MTTRVGDTSTADEIDRHDVGGVRCYVLKNITSEVRVDRYLEAEGYKLHPLFIKQ